MHHKDTYQQQACFPILNYVITAIELVVYTVQLPEISVI